MQRQRRTDIEMGRFVLVVVGRIVCRFVVLAKVDPITKSYGSMQPETLCSIMLLNFQKPAIVTDVKFLPNIILIHESSIFC